MGGRVGAPGAPALKGRPDCCTAAPLLGRCGCWARAPSLATARQPRRWGGTACTAHSKASSTATQRPASTPGVRPSKRRPRPASRLAPRLTLPPCAVLPTPPAAAQNGEPCRMPVNAARCPYCPYHVQARMPAARWRCFSCPLPAACHSPPPMRARGAPEAPALALASLHLATNFPSQPSRPFAIEICTWPSIPSQLMNPLNPFHATDGVQQAEAHRAQRVPGQQPEDRLSPWAAEG